MSSDDIVFIGPEGQEWDRDEWIRFMGVKARNYSAEQQRHLMETDSSIHLLRQLFIERLDRDELTAILKLVVGIRNNEDPSALCGYWEGVITSVLDRRFEICSACNKNHDELAAELMAQEAERREAEQRHQQENHVPLPPGMTPMFPPPGWTLPPDLQNWLDQGPGEDGPHRDR